MEPSKKTFVVNTGIKLPEGSPILKLILERQEFITQFQNTLREMPLVDVLRYWRDYERQRYWHSYRHHIDEMINRSIFPTAFADGKPFETGAFKLLKWPSIYKYIISQSDWSEEIKEEVVECYKAFANWLSLISFQDFKPEDMFHQKELIQDSKVPTFQDWRVFIETLGEQNKRDELLARTIMQGQRRISEVVNLTLNQINFDTNTISFVSNNRTIAICYEKSFITELKEYVESTASIRGNSPYVFITRTGKHVTRRRLNHAFTYICQQSRIKRNITPEILRTLWEKFKKEKYKDTAIMHSKAKRIMSDIEMQRLEFEKLSDVSKFLNPTSPK